MLDADKMLWIFLGVIIAVMVIVIICLMVGNTTATKGGGGVGSIGDFSSRCNVGDSPDVCWKKAFGDGVMCDTTDCYKPGVCPFPPKCKTKNGNSFHLALWMEQVPLEKVEFTEELFQRYTTSYINFVKSKNITRCFFLISDPAKIGNMYCSPPKDLEGPYDPNSFDLLIKYWMLEMPNDVEMGFVIALDEKWPWSWMDGKIVGGFGCSNPNNLLPQVKCTSIGDDKVDWQLWTDPIFNGSCPNSMAQSSYLIYLIQKRFVYWANNPTKFKIDIKNTTTSNNTIKSISTLAADFEGAGPPVAQDIVSMTTWKKFIDKYCSDETLFPYGVSYGIAGEHSAVAKDICAQNIYPEFYWFGELGQYPSSAPAGFCQYASDQGYNICTKDNNYTDHMYCGGVAKADYKSGDAVGCFNTIFNTYNKASDMGNLYWGENFLGKESVVLRNKNADSSYWPLFSIENINIDANNNLIPLEGGKACIDQCFGRANPDRCGTFRGLGNWSWEEFQNLVYYMVDTYKLPNVCIYAWNFVPMDWLDTPATCGGIPVPPPADACLVDTDCAKFGKYLCAQSACDPENGKCWKCDNKICINDYCPTPTPPSGCKSDDDCSGSLPTCSSGGCQGGKCKKCSNGTCSEQACSAPIGNTCSHKDDCAKLGSLCPYTDNQGKCYDCLSGQCTYTQASCGSSSDCKIQSSCSKGECDSSTNTCLVGCSNGLCNYQKCGSTPVPPPVGGCPTCDGIKAGSIMHCASDADCANCFSNCTFNDGSYTFCRTDSVQPYCQWHLT